MKNLRSSLLLLSVLAVLFSATGARAITITATTIINPTTVAAANPGSFTITGPNGLFADLLSEHQPYLSTLNFNSDPNYLLMTNIASASLTLSVGGMDTTSISFDFNNLSLGLGLHSAPLGAGYYNTGLLLNGSDNAIFTPSTLSFNQNVINGNLILSQLYANSGLLDIGIIDQILSPSNDFGIYGGSLTLTLNTQPIPFTPVQSLGLIVVAGVAGLKRWRRQRLVTVAA